jgi:hypothetical protein
VRVHGCLSLLSGTTRGGMRVMRFVRRARRGFRRCVSIR